MGSACASPEQDFPSLPACPHARLAIEREELQRALWMQVGHGALEDFQKFQPHVLPSFSQLARLIDIGISFGRLSTGLETTQREAPPELPGYCSAGDALQKIYGKPFPDELLDL